MSVTNEKLICIPMIFVKLIFTFKFRNMTIILTVTVCIASKVHEINTGRNKHICKKFLLALVCTIALIDTAFDAFSAILVMVPVDAVFSGG